MNWRNARLIGALVGVLALVSATPASATEVEDEGLWYFDRFLVQDAHDEGFTGEGVTIAMIDSQVNLDVPTLHDADIRVQDAPCIREDGSRPAGASDDYEMASHGTAVLSMLVGSGKGYPGQTGVKGLAPDATVLTYYAQLREEHDAGGGCPGSHAPDPYSLDGTRPVLGVMDEIGMAVYAAIDDGADIINISMVGPLSGVLSMAIGKAIYEGVIVVAGVKNEGDYVSGTAPARNNGVLSVNQIDADGYVPYEENTDVVAPGRDILHQGAIVTDVGPDWERQTLRTGTSFATPVVVGNLALAMQKYPEATSNQLIQSLIHNTGAEPHDLMWDETFGYGVVITDVFLAADPTVYPDVNPLVHNYGDLFPAPAEIWDGVTLSEELVPDGERPWPVFTPEPGAGPSRHGPEMFDQGDEAEPKPASTGSPSPTAESLGEPSEQPSMGWLLPSIVIGVVLLVALAVVITLVATRSHRSTGRPHGHF